ncbi:FtsX-like permease family protein [Isoptericola sp. BMS4]|uniref:FtsX-like permease family protein n=1 Tax=Isoptericola sp. BMS4 TaxID=2527875 RepID=UPI0014213065|nr:FtsX-like permease family protein [Isoptericola sp. BMS4]
MLRLLLRRHLATVRGAGLVLALVALLTAAVATTAVREVADLRARQVEHAVQDLTPLVRDVVSTSGRTPGTTTGTSPPLGGLVEGDPVPQVPPDPGWDRFLAGMRELAATRPAPLRDVLGAPDLTVQTRPVAMRDVPGSGLEENAVVLRATARLDESFRLVDGAWPAATPIAVTPAGPAGDAPVEVVATERTAETLGWEIGEDYRADVWQHPPLRLVGVVAPVDPDAGTWYHQPFGLEPQVTKDFERGDLATAAAYTAPAMIDALAARGAQTRLWYPVTTQGLDAADVPALAAQVRGLTNDTPEVVPGDPVRLQAATGLAGVLDEVVAERVGTDAVLAVLLVGPLGALVAAVALAARLLVERGRATLAVLRARGATSGQLHALVAAEGLVVCVPAAAAGLVLGLVVRPGGLTGTQVLLTVVAAVAPAAAGAASVPRDLRPQRADLTGRRRSRARLTAELLLVGLAVVATALLLRRGVVSGGVDPLLAATPLLVSAAATVLAVRAAPHVARVLERALARRDDLVAFLGAARATRAPAGGVVPALALVLCVTVTASSAVVLSTLRAGTERQAHLEVGADLRVTGPVVTPEALAGLRDHDGVAEVATVARLDDVGTIVHDAPGTDGRTPVAVLVADADALARVQAAVPGAPTGVQELDEPPDDGTLRVVAHGVPGGEDAVLELGEASVDVEVAARVGTVPGVPVHTPFVLVDAGRAAGALGVAPEPRTALVALDDHGAAGAVRDLVRDVVGERATVDDPRSAAAARMSSPSVAGIAVAAATAVAVAGVLGVLVVAMMLVLAAPDRERLLGVLRSLGLRRGEARGIVAWEVGPWAVVALVVGGALGLVVPALLRAGVDLTPLTGGGRQPSLALDPVLALAGAAGFVAVVVVGTLLASVGGRSAAVDGTREE